MRLRKPNAQLTLPRCRNKTFGENADLYYLMRMARKYPQHSPGASTERVAIGALPGALMLSAHGFLHKR
jgi:hypothetical protein